MTRQKRPELIRFWSIIKLETVLLLILLTCGICVTWYGLLFKLPKRKWNARSWYTIELFGGRKKVLSKHKLTVFWMFFFYLLLTFYVHMHKFTWANHVKRWLSIRFWSKWIKSIENYQAIWLCHTMEPIFMEPNSNLILINWKKWLFNHFFLLWQLINATCHTKANDSIFVYWVIASRTVLVIRARTVWCHQSMVVWFECLCFMWYQVWIMITPYRFYIISCKWQMFLCWMWYTTYICVTVAINVIRINASNTSSFSHIDPVCVYRCRCGAICSFSHCKNVLLYSISSEIPTLHSINSISIV